MGWLKKMNGACCEKERNLKVEVESQIGGSLCVMLAFF